MKKSGESKKKFMSYLSLTNNETKEKEYFKLFKDNEIGFDTTLQESVKESVDA